jgi:hypothetical protein
MQDPELVNQLKERLPESHTAADSAAQIATDPKTHPRDILRQPIEKAPLPAASPSPVVRSNDTPETQTARAIKGPVRESSGRLGHGVTPADIK